MESVFAFFADHKFYDLTYTQIFSCFFLIVLTLFIAKFFRVVSTKYIKKLTAKTKTTLDDRLIDELETPITWLFYVSGLYFAILVLNPTNDTFPLRDIVQATAETLIACIITWALCIITDIFTETFRFAICSKAKKSAEIKGEKFEEPMIIHFLPLFKRALKVLLVFIALIIIIQNRGYSVTSLIAGFGISGLAIGFAAKDSIANIFGSVAVMIDHVYKIGDWVIVSKSVAGDDAEGIVEDISLRSTKIRAFDRTLITIPNNEMANATIKNVSKHDKRRILAFLDIEYDTPPEKVLLAVDICKRIVENHPGMDSYKEVHFVEFGAHSLRIMLYLFTKTNVWHDFMVIRQELFLAIMQEFEKEGIRFAYPTQTLYLNTEKSLEVCNSRSIGV